MIGNVETNTIFWIADIQIHIMYFYSNTALHAEINIVMLI